MSRDLHRPWRRGASLAAVALFAIGALAAAAPAPTVDTIVADYIAARGGVTKIRSIQTLRQKGHAIADAGHQGIVLRELKRPTRSGSSSPSRASPACTSPKADKAGRCPRSTAT